MIIREKVKKMRQKSPYQAESVYLYAKLWRESLETGSALDIQSMRHINFERNFNTLRTGHDSLYDDIEELIAIWENEIAV